jgi:hypothetical protein
MAKLSFPSTRRQEHILTEESKRKVERSKKIQHLAVHDGLPLYY